MIGYTFDLLRRTECIAFYRIFVGETFGAGQLVHPGIRPGIHDVVLDVHGLAVFGHNHRHRMVSVLEILTVPFVDLFYQFRAGQGFGIHTPLAIQLGYTLTGDVEFSVGMCGAVLSGAILGDHASPVSDTTVMASIFSGADHIDHVGTQLPYALTVGGVIAVLYLIFGFTEISPFVLLPIGVVMLFFLQIILHKIYMKRYNIDPNYTKFMTEDHVKQDA